MTTITVATFNERTPAEVLQTRLAAAGVPAEIHDKSTVGRLWLTPKNLAAFRLDVATADYARALQLLHDWHAADGALRAAIHCPECGSSRVEYPQLTRKFILPNFVAFLSVLHVVEKKYYCEDCHCTWFPEGHKPARLRPHSAPYYFIDDVPETRPGLSAPKRV